LTRPAFGNRYRWGAIVGAIPGLSQFV
jgi:hypothetical protein